jgi:hypothetical protein
MRKTDMTGRTCVGELRLSCLDVGFDLRGSGTVQVPEQFSSAGIERDGRVWLIKGTRAEMISAIRAAGYRISPTPPSTRPKSRPKIQLKRRRNKPKAKDECGSL